MLKIFTRTILILSVLLVFQFAIAQEGTLDPDFGDNGSRRFAFIDKSTRGTDMLLLDGGSIILGVNSEISVNGALRNRGFYIYKITNEGDIDPEFGDDGHLYFPNKNNEASSFRSMLLQFDGKILIKCSIEGDSKLIRIDENGTFDPGFGNNGIQTISGGGEIAQQSNSKIIIQSQYWDGYNNLYSFSRRNTDGSLDTSFGINGTQITDVTSYRFDLCFTIKIDIEDRILAAGASYNNGDDYHPVITRFNENGALDTSFGNDGTVIATFSPASNLGQFNDIALLNDKIIVGGNMEYSGGTGGLGGIKPAIAKFNNDGTFDETFGQEGKVVFETYYNANDRLRSIAVQRDGKILLGGGTSSPFPIVQTDLFIIKVNRDGSIYSGFGDNGIFVTNLEGADSNYVTDLVLQPDNKVLAFGCTKSANNEFRNAIICRLDNEFLGVDNFLLENEIQFFPNPASDYIKIKSKNTIQRLEVYNILGQLIGSELYGFNLLEIEYDLNRFQNGVYTFLIFLEDEKVISKKVVKKP